MVTMTMIGDDDVSGFYASRVCAVCTAEEKKNTTQ